MEFSHNDDNDEDGDDDDDEDLAENEMVLVQLVEAELCHLGFR